MAGDWIKMRSALLANPKVHGIAKVIGQTREASAVLTTGAAGTPDSVLSRNALRNVTVTALLVTWSSANEHTSDGVLRFCDLGDIDAIAGIPGFGRAMESVGWAVYDETENAVILPNFAEWNTPAKDRTNAERQRRHRERNGSRNALRNALPVTAEKRREELEKREEKHTTHTGGGSPASLGWAATEWESFVSVWNRTARAKPWTPLLAPEGWVDHAASPGWLAKAREAMARLPTCEFFRDPVAVTRFFGYVDRILAGEFDTAKQDGREQNHQRRRQPTGGNL